MRNVFAALFIIIYSPDFTIAVRLLFHPERRILQTNVRPEPLCFDRPIRAFAAINNNNYGQFIADFWFLPCITYDFIVCYTFEILGQHVFFFDNFF